MKNLSHFLRLSVLVIVTGIAITGNAQTNYYSKSTGNLNQTTSWGTNTDGTGTAPANFTTANRIFNIRNNAAPTISADWTVSGTGSYIVVGDGTDACNFKIPTADWCKGTIDVSAYGTLTIANTTIPTLGTLDPNSTVVFDGTNSQAIPAVTYGNLTYSGSTGATGTMAGGCTISGTLSVTSGIFVMDNSNSNSYTYTIGSLTVTTSQHVELGLNNKSTTINLSGNYSQSGTGYLITTGAAINGTINFTGANQTAQQSGSNYVNYIVTSGSDVTLTGNFVYGSDDAGYNAGFTVSSGGTLICSTYELLKYSNYPYETFTLSSGGTISTANTAGLYSTGATGTVQVTTRDFSSGANYTYNGTAAQNTGVFTTTGSAVNNLTIDNSSATGVTLSQSETVDGVLTLTDGLLNPGTETLTVNNGGSTTGASNSSFVNGPISKVGNQAFVFPVGVSGTGYVPIGISAPSSATDNFVAQYIRASAAARGPVSAPDLNHVSSCDYWTLNHTAGSSAVNVTGYWNGNNPCGGTYVNDLATIALAHFNGTSWNAFGNIVTPGSTNAAGSVTWNDVSTFSPFALGSTSIFDPLPLTLVDFNAQWQKGGTVGLTWEVQDGVDVSHFDIQRSADGVSWQTIGTLAASGSSVTANYSYTDADPLPAMDYYRLQLVDDAGNDTYSTVKVVSQTAAGYGITIFPNPAIDHINVSFSSSGVTGPVNIRLMNVTEQVLLQKSVTQPAGETTILPVTGYPAGSYLVQVIGEGQIKQSSIVIIVK